MRIVGQSVNCGRWSCTAAPGSGVSSQGCLCSAEQCSALLCSQGCSCSAPSHSPALLLHHTFLLSLAAAFREQQWWTEYGQGRSSGQPAKCPICQLPPNSDHSFHFSVQTVPLYLTLLVFFSGECNGRNLNFAMPLLRGKDESDAAVAAVGSCHHSSARLRAEADGAAPWLHGGGSQRDDPGPGSSRVRLPLPVHLLPIPAASGYKCVRLWPGSSEGAVHSSWSSLPFPC